ncbi:alpha/beta-hydrolase [Teratosphaeria nubilosa]|uniref:Alpha/beta-hydrolase n=1 Tax=Teratosphaeria nubilosa TaxID=161662 RepID=A0A6G1L753_9PEZI|nr:alpha/beta-hydrolase [Teratosphaeria nubilosa]
MSPKRHEEQLAEHLRPTITVTKRTNRSIRMFLLQHLLKPFHAQLTKPRKEYPAGSPKLEPHKKAYKQCDVTERQVEGIYIYDITARIPKSQAITAEKARRKRIYYFNGGGWQMPASSEHWALCHEFAIKIPNSTVSIVSYPLAPHSPAPVAIPQLLKMYHTLLREAETADEDVILAGDSAGGNIVLCLTIGALMEDPTNAPVPKALMCISPSTDLRRHNPDIKVIEKHDPLLRTPFINMTAKKWRGEWDPHDPRISPLYADVTALAKRGVKVHGVVGRYDILGPDAVLMREKCNQLGVRGEWLDWEKQMHCFPLTWSFYLPEGVQAKDWMVDVLRRT